MKTLSPKSRNPRNTHEPVFVQPPEGGWMFIPQTVMAFSRDDRVVPEVEQFTVPDDHPELVAFLYQATRNFGCAI